MENVFSLGDVRLRVGLRSELERVPEPVVVAVLPHSMLGEDFRGEAACCLSQLLSWGLNTWKANTSHFPLTALHGVCVSPNPHTPSGVRQVARWILSEHFHAVVSALNWG